MPITFKQYLSENSQEFLQDKNDITKWLDFYNIKNYTIEEENDVYVVDVQGDVKLHSRNLITLPVQFRNVYGHFLIGENKLSSLKGCPMEVTDSFQAQRNPYLQTYDFLPKKSTMMILGRDSVRTLVGINWEEIETQDLRLDTHVIRRGGMGLIFCKDLSFGMRDIKAGYPNGNLAEPFQIISKYFRRPNDIYECQAELIEHGFEAYTEL